MTRGALLTLILLALTALAPLALADHAYSHRIVIYGRVIDAEGKPFPGLTVGATPQNMETEGQCGSQPMTETDAFGPTQTKPVTNEHGEFTFCIHAHRLSRAAPGNIVIRIESLNYLQTVNVDPFLRVHYVPIQLDQASAPARAPAFTDHTILGRLWDPADDEVKVEGVPVFGSTIDRTPVNITLTLTNGTSIRTNTTTNNYGDFAVRVPLDEPADAARVTIEASGRTFEEDADPLTGATFVRAEYGERPTGRSMTAIVVIGAVVVAGGAIAVYSFVRTPTMRKKKGKVAKKARK